MEHVSRQGAACRVGREAGRTPTYSSSLVCDSEHLYLGGLDGLGDGVLGAPHRVDV